MVLDRLVLIKSKIELDYYLTAVVTGSITLEWCLQTWLFCSERIVAYEMLLSNP